MKLKIYCMLAGVLMMASCDKELEVSEAPSFEVSAASATYQVGQEVKFEFKGDADIISFYSGQILNDYAFRDGRVIDVSNAEAILSFTSAVTGGTQADQLSVLYSTDFNGNYENMASVKAATWTDITRRFKFGTNATFLASDPLNLSDLLVSGKPIYIAFKYITRPQAENGLARTWMIQNFTIKSGVTLGTNALTIIDQLNAGFRIVDENKVNAPAQSVVTGTRISLLGNVYKQPNDPIFNPNNPIYDRESPSYNPSAVYVPYDPNSPYNDLQSENWAISKPIIVNEVDLGPDWAIAIKGMDTQTKGYNYRYTTPGIYKAYFVASNNTIHQNKQVIKSVDVTITE